MPRIIVAYVRAVESLNYRIGRATMYLIFVMIAVLMWSSISKVAFLPAHWTLETAQFLMVAYYILGGPYSIQMGTNVRMDLIYGGWSARRKAMVDAFMVFFLLFYLAVLLYGAIGSTAYSLGYWGTEPFAFFRDLAMAFLSGGPEAAGEVIGRLERSSTAWRPYMWPIKVVMVIGIFLMLLQATAEFFKDLARMRGLEIGRGARAEVIRAPGKDPAKDSDRSTA
ncbi:TRAP-type mannitol/chloroaromatic compound transport system, small permease component [Meinhardsimonia xiamenensis]|jgi:TRAP-type mannitol/chloroaromatic compound transport system permease small subunit|uniref:TRAP transporter small permease protein n=1 Tax=Meinhardsimonia xiamenensis TaxID=990712 RepID=A0A1G9G7E3_9RHOB|nr:TRAP transporter small permease subunit [Meinhardsimonia xiamenensis]PRX32652.1 TRAP-type mannitol/chloroaromatic compound transport system permease small subunit [Meinhardsimonia xiamenensis]SDK96465.1 TRAP-type mannitol/chloroaromatic compound transport system, small permease component [Meinhardsimonia xiamenensis]